MKDSLATSAAARFRYRGFRQDNGVREYQFEDVGDEKNTHAFIVGVDLCLLYRHHLHFQDAPLICIQILSGSPLARDVPNGTVVRISISDNDLTELVAKSEQAAGTNRKRRRC